MLSPSDIQMLISDALFPGAESIFGLVAFAIVMWLILTITRDTTIMAIVAIPTMLVLTYMGWMDTTLTFLIIIIMILLLAMTLSNAVFGGNSGGEGQE